MIKCVIEEHQEFDDVVNTETLTVTYNDKVIYGRYFR